MTRTSFVAASSAFVVLATGCANPLNLGTSDRYAEQCAVAERADRSEEAEQACYRAIANVDWGNLGSALKSQRFYNLARIKRRLSRFAVAEDLLAQSIAIANGLSGDQSVKSGRRCIELAVSSAGQQRWTEGAIDLARGLPMAGQYSTDERAYVKEAVRAFVAALRRERQEESAAALEKKAVSL